MVVGSCSFFGSDLLERLRPFVCFVENYERVLVYIEGEKDVCRDIHQGLKLRRRRVIWVFKHLSKRGEKSIM